MILHLLWIKSLTRGIEWFSLLAEWINVLAAVLVLVYVELLLKNELDILSFTGLLRFDTMIGFLYLLMSLCLFFNVRCGLDDLSEVKSLLSKVQLRIDSTILRSLILIV